MQQKNGEMKLEVKSNDYLSVKPEVGTQLTYKHYFGTKTLRTTIGVAYENELGRVANGKNNVKVANTNADWFNIRGEKEDRRGNVKFDLNVGLDNQRYGVTANAGYDTKGHNIREVSWKWRMESLSIKLTAAILRKQNWLPVISVMLYICFLLLIRAGVLK